MRDTKFRYRIKEQSGEINFLYVEMAHIEKPLIYGEIYWDSFTILSRDEYTGLIDKDGEEIYECDIVECDDFICLVKWIQAYPGEPGFILEGGLIHADMRNGKVIGNIYENPKLLEEPE